jgi:hypothetical protein
MDAVLNVINPRVRARPGRALASFTSQIALVSASLLKDF